jgi:eukaryotic-like serine/threonine-protein kinase
VKIDKPRLSVGDELIGRYKIIREIGQGGMQQVYLAEDTSLKRNVALKVPIGTSAEKRFERSARLSARIIHPNIAKTLDYSRQKDIEFLIEEFIPGSNLQQRLDSDFVNLDPHLVAHIIHHLAKAVAAMNKSGVIHRDLKPSNIMVSDDLALAEIKVTDFGVAAMADAEIDEAVKGGTNSIVASKTVVGALAFMAPELIKREDSVDRAKCDVWSVGALLYFLLFNEYPFGDGLAAIQNILNGSYTNKQNIISLKKAQFQKLYSSLWNISKQCLTMRPDDRPTANEVASKLSEVCYSNAPRRAGRIGYLSPSNGFWGFIKPEDGGNDVFFHYDSMIGGQPQRGLRVMFSDFRGQPQSRAHPVVPFKVR